MRERRPIVLLAGLIATLSSCSLETADKASLERVRIVAVHVRVAQRLAVGSVAFDAPKRFPLLYGTLQSRSWDAVHEWLSRNPSNLVSLVLVPPTDPSTGALYDYVEGASGWSAAEAKRTDELSLSLQKSLAGDIVRHLNSDVVLWMYIRLQADMGSDAGSYGKHQGTVHGLRVSWIAQLWDRSSKAIWHPGLTAILAGERTSDNLSFGTWTSERWQTGVGKGTVSTKYSVNLDQQPIAEFATTASRSEAFTVFRSLLDAVAAAKSGRSA